MRGTRHAVRGLTHGLGAAAALSLLAPGPLIPSARAQGNATASIVGHLVDRQTRSPVQGAHVRLTWTGRSTTSDTAGRFELKDLVPGIGLLQARAIGYRMGSWAVTLAEQSEVSDTFELESVPVELSELVVPARPDDDWRSPAAFEARRRKGGGYFVTEEMLRQQRPATWRKSCDRCRASSRCAATGAVRCGW